jgi:hypothetical protein
VPSPLAPHRESACDILIVGGGTGGCAAAMAACSLGFSVVLTEETDWIGGQLTAQAVPPDEHPWIESFGCTRRYRRYRDLVRRHYEDHTPLTEAARERPFLNPGGGWVSRLCHEPRIGWLVLNAMLNPYVGKGRYDLRLRRKPVGVAVAGDRIDGVRFLNLENGREETVRAEYVLDATELGDLLALGGIEYVLGAESRRETGEPHAVDGDARPEEVQGITWCFALGYEAGGSHTIDRPAAYDRWRDYRPDFWPGPLLGFDVLYAHTNEPRKLPLFADDWYELFSYRQVIDPAIFERPDHEPHPVTIVNWPQNDYFAGGIVDADDPLEPGSSTQPLGSGPVSDRHLLEARELSLSLLYWLQTEAPRHDGGVGYPELYLRPDVTGTPDGFAKTAYIREGRRIRAKFTVLEQHVSAELNPGQDRAVEFADSVGVGCYRIDLHPSAGGANTIDVSTLPFQIPLGALIPVRVRNLLPAGKNLGVTHITNGCYRLHPVEWNVGEAAGALAAFCLRRGVEPHQVHESPDLVEEFQALLREQGVEMEWPRLRAV